MGKFLMADSLVMLSLETSHVSTIYTFIFQLSLCKSHSCPDKSQYLLSSASGDRVQKKKKKFF